MALMKLHKGTVSIHTTPLSVVHAVEQDNAMDCVVRIAMVRAKLFSKVVLIVILRIKSIQTIANI